MLRGLLLTSYRFAGGKASALVIDVGAANTSITPVHDGLILKKGDSDKHVSCIVPHIDLIPGVMRSPLAGNFVSQQLRLLFANANPPVPITPHYLVSSKTSVDSGASAQATYKTFAPPLPDSFRRLEEERVLTEFKESVVQVWAGPGRLSSGSHGTTNEEVVKSWPGRPFEMPDGWNQVFGAERFKAVEGMFDVKMALTVWSPPLTLSIRATRSF